MSNKTKFKDKSNRPSTSKVVGITLNGAYREFLFRLAEKEKLQPSTLAGKLLKERLDQLQEDAA